MKKIITKLSLFFCMFMFLSCASSSYKDFYTSSAPMEFEATENVYIFDYGTANIDEVYQLLFSDFFIIGKSGFLGPMEDPADAEDFAKELGADVFISCQKFYETYNYTYTTSTPTTSTTSVYDSKGKYIGSTTTRGYEETLNTASVNRYNQDGYFLKNVNHVKPIFEKTKADFDCSTAPKTYAGIWKDDTYTVEILKSGDNIVGFVTTSKNDNWNDGDLKFIFSEVTGEGLYMMGNRTPIISKFEINKFGFLEVKLGLGYKYNKSFTFMKQ
ncbi:MAG: hypothetical protein IJS09_11165 [Treponema sp.]|nr:hypothetical protein [Treponema sp.]